MARVCTKLKAEPKQKLKTYTFIFLNNVTTTNITQYLFLANMKTKKILLALTIVSILAATYVWFFVYNKSHVDFQEEDAAFTGQADELHQQAIADAVTFLEKYRNKAVQVEGVVTEAGSQGFTLNNGIICNLEASSTQNVPTVGEKIMVKGRVVGTDEDLITAEIICNLDQCVIVAH